MRMERIVVQIVLIERCFWVQMAKFEYTWIFETKEIAIDENKARTMRFFGKLWAIVSTEYCLSPSGALPSFYNEDFFLQLSRWQALHEIPEIPHL